MSLTIEVVSMRRTVSVASALTLGADALDETRGDSEVGKGDADSSSPGADVAATDQPKDAETHQ